MFPVRRERHDSPTQKNSILRAEKKLVTHAFCNIGFALYGAQANKERKRL